MSGEILTEKRLILGFDAGCVTCNDLARRIEERVGDKLEIRNLRDPQVAHWREQALGEDAPWAPTLVEVNEGEVNAWTGPKMGLRLARFLGPVATWRVMQAIGKPQQRRTEQSEQTLPEESSAALTRRQLLKGGAAGAVAGAGLLVGTNRFGSETAKAQTASNNPEAVSQFPKYTPKSTGTTSQQNRAKEIARSSGPYEKLVADQSAYGASFNFDQAVVNVDGDYASVTIPSHHTQRSVIAIFLVDLVRGFVGNINTVEASPTESGQAAHLVVQENFSDAEKFSRVTLKQDHMIAEGRRMSYQEANAELDTHIQQKEYQLQSACSRAVGYIAGGLSGGSCAVVCGGLGFISLSLGGVACGSACGIVAAAGADAAVQCICNGREEVCPCTRCT